MTTSSNGSCKICGNISLIYSSNSPPFLFVLSEFIYPDNQQAFLQSRLNYDESPSEVEENIRGSPLESVFLVPSISSLPNSLLRRIESAKWLEGDSDGNIVSKRVDLYFLNMLRLPEVPKIRSFWTRVDNIIDSYPRPTIKNPLPILTSHRNGRTELFNVTWLTRSFADEKVLKVVDQGHEIVNEEFGCYNPLQVEEARLGDCGMIAFSHLSKCIGRGDITGIMGIIRDVRRVCDALESLIREDYHSREVAMTSFPLIDHEM